MWYNEQGIQKCDDWHKHTSCYLSKPIKGNHQPLMATVINHIWMCRLAS